MNYCVSAIVAKIQYLRGCGILQGRNRTIGCCVKTFVDQSAPMSRHIALLITVKDNTVKIICHFQPKVVFIWKLLFLMSGIKSCCWNYADKEFPEPEPRGAQNCFFFAKPEPHRSELWWTLFINFFAATVIIL
jgi:hypothetical protein